MKCLHIFRMLNSTSGISCYRPIHTDQVMFARRKTRSVPHKINNEPGLRHTEAAWSENSDVLEIQSEEDLENVDEFMNFDKVYDMNEDERVRKKRLGYIITAKKFFKGPPQPSTLSSNERECIRYLYKTDPVQWNIKTLSESFPATPDAIRKVLKGKFKFSEEIKRKMDLKVQRNWQLLSEGKLQAAPEVLEHLKKFINRREVLLDQIKKADFYLPEVKEEVIWNNGEMSNILAHYEKAIEKLTHKQEPHKYKMLSDGSGGSGEPSRKIKKAMNICANSDKSEELKDVEEKWNLPDRAKFTFSNEFEKEKVFYDVSAKAEIEGPSSAMKKSEEKSSIKGSGNKKDFSDPERLRLEDQYYANQVKDIENTAFWNKGRTSQDKALAENEKVPLGGPDIPARAKICSSDVYPERIKIPRDKRGSGLTFRVKDCYYDDDGEFLYRVPGMVK